MATGRGPLKGTLANFFKNRFEGLRIAYQQPSHKTQKVKNLEASKFQKVISFEAKSFTRIPRIG
jgi:hypothetical protein